MHTTSSDMNNDENVVVAVRAQFSNSSTTFPMTNVTTSVPTLNEQIISFTANSTLGAEPSYEENPNNVISSNVSYT